MRLCTYNNCGEPCEDGRCTEHRPATRPDRGTATQRGYNSAWSRLSKQARRLQPWCSDCGTKTDLTGDHLRWPALSLKDVDVVCRPCNSKRGAARSLTGQAVDPQRLTKDPRCMANIFTLIENGSHLEGGDDG